MPLADPSVQLRLNARVQVDLQRQCVWRDGLPLSLRPKAWQALQVLLHRPGELVTADALLDALWPNQDISAKTMANLVSELRAALGDDGVPPQLLQTVHRRGYRLQPAPLAPADAAAPPEQGPARTLDVAAALQARAALPAHQANPPAALVGRQAEWARLQRLHQQSLAGQRQLVLLAADTGMGKTALLDAFEASTAGTDRTATVTCRVACLEQHTEREPFAPLLGLLADLCNGPLAGQASAALRRCAPTWLAQMPWLVQPHELPELRKSLAGMGIGRMLREGCALLQALCSHTPLLLVLDDLHWADAATIDLLGVLAADRAPARLMVAGSYQPFLATLHQHPVAALAARLQAQGLATVLPLPPLRPADVAQVISQRYPAALVAPLQAWAEPLAMGVPLVLDAALNHLQDSGALAWQKGAWQLLHLPAADTPLEPLRHLVAAQLARLDTRTRQLLQAASAVGMQVPVQLLAAALQQAPDGVEQACSTLARQGQFLQAHAPVHWPDGSHGGAYSFMHDSQRRVIYDGLAPALRVGLHRRVALRLEAGWAGQLAPVAGALADAYSRACMPEAAARVLEVTAQVSAQRFAYGATISALQACLQQLALPRHALHPAADPVFGHAPSNPSNGQSAATASASAIASQPNQPSIEPGCTERIATEIRVNLMLANISLNHHGLTGPLALPAFERAQRLAQASGALREQVRAQLGATVSHVARFAPQAACALAHHTVALAEAQQPTLAAAAHHYAGLAEAVAGQLEAARRHQAQSLRLQPDPLVPLYMDVPSSAQLHLGRTLCLVGQVDQGLAQMEAGLARGRAVSTPADLTHKLFWAADTLRLLGLTTRAQALLQETLARAEAFDQPGLRAACQWSLAALPAPAQRDQALLASRALAHCRPNDHHAALAHSLAMTETHLAQGDAAAAQAAWAEGRAVAPTGALFDPEMHRLHGLLMAAGLGSPDQAEARFRAGLALARQQGAGLHALRCAQALAEHRAAHGQAARGRALLRRVLASLPPGCDAPDFLQARQWLQA